MTTGDVLTLTGDGSLALTVDAATVSAAGYAGDMTVTATAAVNASSYTLGTGNDSLYISTSGLNQSTIA
jgi:hypothetical protein